MLFLLLKYLCSAYLFPSSMKTPDNKMDRRISVSRAQHLRPYRWKRGVTCVVVNRKPGDDLSPESIQSCFSRVDTTVAENDTSLL